MLYDRFVRITHYIHMETKNWYRFTVLPNNIPTKCAGIYSLTHIPSGRIYIGISGDLEKRIREHGRPHKRESKVGRAIREFGAESFLAIPLYYTLDGSADGLTKLETEMIALHDSICSGFNVIANSSKAGKRGEAYCRAAKAGKNTPEAIAKRLRILSDPNESKKRGDAIRLAHARPETKERLRARPRAPLTAENLQKLRAAHLENLSDPVKQARKAELMRMNHADPEFKERHLKGVRQANADPLRNSKIAESRKGGIWITNGTDDNFVRSDAVIPEGWTRGRTRNRKAA